MSMTRLKHVRNRVLSNVVQKKITQLHNLVESCTNVDYVNSQI